MATTKITSPDLFNLESLNTALKLPSGTTAQRPTSPSTGEWRYNTTTNLVEFWDGGAWRELQSEDIPPIPSEHFEVVTFTGDDTASKFIEVGFTPDFVWIKPMSVVSSHALYDSTRGDNNRISSNSNGAQSTVPNEIVTNGFNIIGGTGYNDSTLGTMVAWCWKAGGGTTSSNTDGTITSTVQVNSKAGFSIVTYTGNSSASQTYGHGLNAEPKFIITKRISGGNAQNWCVWHTGLTSENKYLELNTTTSELDGLGTAYNSGISSSVVGIGNSGIMNASHPYLSYCFADVAGYSKFGSYTGNGSATGPIVNTGFEPAMVIVKSTTSSEVWLIRDNKRNTSNPRNSILEPNTSDAEATASQYDIDFLSNGFQVKGTGASSNANGQTFIYIAFAADASTAPVLADSFANKLWTGNGSARDINVGFSPSLTWIKSRSFARNNYLYDILRGPNNQILSNDSGAQATITGRLTAFNTSGFSLGTDSEVNNNAETYVAWNWKANPVPTINTDGTIQSIASANQAAGFSIVKYVGNGVQGATVAHGLGSAPDLIILKDLSSSEVWLVGNSESGWTKAMHLDLSNADNASNLYWDDTAPTSSVFSLGAIGSSYNVNGNQYIAYCWYSISGYSKIGSYTGNGSAGYAITGLGFQPSFIMIKGTTSADNWFIFDSARGGSVTLNPNLAAAEYADTGVTSFDSDGFTLGSNAGGNRNGDTYIYMAFKENLTPYPLAGNMSFLVIAGGGSGGARDAGPGGAGGLRTSYGPTSGGGAAAESDITLAAGTYTITIGAGGAKVVEVTAITPGNQGVNSSLSGTGMTTVTSLGGGKGGDGAGTSPGTGGSGGGGTAGQSGGSGTSGQGFSGAAGTGGYTSGGGGGAGATGVAPPSNENGGAGGAGLSVSITGSSTAYAGGGGGSGDTSGGAGGTGGGGAGQNDAAVDATSGTANTGGGGGSHRQNLGTSGAGGSGVVILRLLTSEYSSSTTGSPTVTTDGDYTVLTYTGSGTYVHS